MITYKQLERKVMFYRVVTVGLICFIMFIGLNNVKTTEAAEKFETESMQKDIQIESLEYQLNDLIESGTCLPRLPELEFKNS